jgi:hypothetical protein
MATAIRNDRNTLAHVQRLANIITIAVTASSVISSLDVSLSEISRTCPSRASPHDAPRLPSDNHLFFFLLRGRRIAKARE